MIFLVGLIYLVSAGRYMSFLADTSDTSYLEVDGPAGITFNDTVQQCTMSYENKTFAVDCTSRVLSCDNGSNCNIYSSLATNATNINAQSLKIGSLRQWQLYQSEWFLGTSESGWTNSSTSYCSGINMLGGYALTAAGTTSKRFSGLPDHNYIRVKANFHFIDKWQGETGYLMIGNSQTQYYVWAERYDYSDYTTAPNLCGDTTIVEGKFSKPIDIIIEHFDSSMTLAFGATLADTPLIASFGVSSLQIFLR